MGTNDWAYLSVLAYPELAPWAVDLIEVVLQGEMGFDLWASCDGANWRAITRDAFGGDRYDFGARNLVPTDGRLFVGSANHAQGTKVWAYRANDCTGTATAAAASAKPTRPPIPQALMTRRPARWDGPLVAFGRDGRLAPATASCERPTPTSSSASSRPHVMPNGFPLEGALPELHAPGAKGSRTADLPVTKGFTTIGTTREPFFVDRTARRGHALRLPGGGRGAVGRALGPVKRAGRAGPAARRRNSAALGARTSDAAATMSRVADDAVARRAMLRRLARLRRAARPGSDRQLLLERLERRVRYAGIADGR